MSTVAVAAGDASSASPPVTEQSIPSAYVWLSGGAVGVGIGYTWGHGTLYYSKDQKQYKFKLSGVSIADVGGAAESPSAATVTVDTRTVAKILKKSLCMKLLLRQ